MAQHDPRTRLGAENVQSFARSSEPDRGATALNLVYQAAEVFSEIEVRAQEAEARAQSLYATAAEKLQFAEDLVESAQRSRREIIADADRRLKEASRALKQAELQITAAEDKAIAADLRAQVAEEKARKAIEALARVEQAIRNRLLGAIPQNAAKGKPSTDEYTFPPQARPSPPSLHRISSDPHHEVEEHKGSQFGFKREGNARDQY